MALSTFLPTPENKLPKRKRTKPSKKQQTSSSWVDQIKSLLTCKQVEGSQVHDPSSSKSNNVVAAAAAGPYTKLGQSCSSICSFKDVVHGNTRVVHRADNSPENSSVGQETGLLSRKAGLGSSNRSSAGSVRSSNGGAAGSTYSSSSRGMQFRKLSGCYECHMIVDPSKYPSPRTTICACSECGEIFHKIESLQHHQATRHAVSELGPDDSGRNIVEIIFKSSWLKKDNPICKIERILKVHNTQRTIQRFEDCRDAVKVRANNNTRKNPRCAADGNELLRFYCTSLNCSLGARGSTSLCGSVPGCGVCTIIRHGFPGNSKAMSQLHENSSSNNSNGVCTTATSGRAHDSFVGTDGGSKPRAMLVCRVIAGRVKRLAEGAASEEESLSSTTGTGSYDSVAGYAGIYANLEELTVFNPRAILPCFVVIYKSLD